ncbi:RNA repair transcriptional activator RtcR [Photobacterium japonica]|uniref:RNA repair transcriptional activator RtcR n=1 Tax=Photobacterium japonica TaxID=2910235 RepID=UPI003D0E44FC
MRKTVAVSLLGTQLDFVGKRCDRWRRWRPNVSLCSQEEVQIDELHLLHNHHSGRLANQIADDIHRVSPETTVILHTVNFTDPWDFGEVYATLFDWCKNHQFDGEQQDLLFHITTGTHVVQICAYLLTESRHFPGRLIQTSPDKNASNRSVGRVQIIDLDLSQYDQLANRFDIEHQEGSAFLKGGIHTQNAAFNRLIGEIEKVAIRSREPILLTGATGAGKSQLASRIFQLKKRRSMVEGECVSVNCATLRGDNAMAALFGHTKGAFTGALKARDGFLLTANNGVLFLDEVGELGLEEQAMLLHAIEHKQFFPVGSDSTVHSDFQLIAGTNRDMKQMIQEGTFREDLLARINLWHYTLPSLRERREDIPANVEFELTRYMEKNNHRVQFNKEAKTAFLTFAQSPDALWLGNFRDLGAAITRLCTLADQSRISVSDVHAEIARLQLAWSEPSSAPPTQALECYLEDSTQLDNFDKQQLSYVLSVCEASNTLAAAGRELYNISRLTKSSTNDASRLQKYLAKFGLAWKAIKSK